MSPQVKNPRSPRRVGSATVCTLTRLALAGFACLLLAVASSATAATAPPQESLANFEGQLRAHHVSTATLHTKAHMLHVTLTDGSRVLIHVSSQSQQQLLAEASANGVTVKITQTKAASHKRRYIAAGVVVVLILLVAGGVLIRRRRLAREEQRPRSPAPTG